MAKKIILKILLVLTLPTMVVAQQDDKIVTLNKLLVCQATIAPGYMNYKGGLWNSYFHATLEWCFDNKVSIRSDGAYFFTTQGDYKPFKMNHSLLQIGRAHV